MSRFFITGPPRSRTAWFAVAASSERGICLHEPSARLNSYDELAALWQPNMGISDSALAMFTGQILADFSPRTLIVERDIDQVVASFERVTGSPASNQTRARLEQCRFQLSRWKHHHLVRTVKFESLRDVHILKSVFAWLVPYKPLAEIQQLAHMNIQSEPRHMMAVAAQGRGRWVFNP